MTSGLPSVRNGAEDLKPGIVLQTRSLPLHPGVAVAAVAVVVAGAAPGAFQRRGNPDGQSAECLSSYAHLIIVESRESGREEEGVHKQRLNHLLKLAMNLRVLKSVTRDTFFHTFFSPHFCFKSVMSYCIKISNEPTKTSLPRSQRLPHFTCALHTG